MVDNGWVIGKDFGHIAHGYVVTSHASQGKTVDKVFIGQSHESLPASDRQQLYVSVSRGREQAVIFTDNKAALREAVARDRERLTATEVFRPRKAPGRERLRRHLSFQRRWASQRGRASGLGAIIYRCKRRWRMKDNSMDLLALRAVWGSRGQRRHSTASASRRLIPKKRSVSLLAISAASGTGRFPWSCGSLTATAWHIPIAGWGRRHTTHPPGCS